MQDLNMDFDKYMIPIGIVLLTTILVIVFNRAFKLIFDKKIDLIKGDPTNYRFLRHAISALIYILGISFAIHSVPELKSIANSMLAGAGIMAVAVGFASQAALSNIISGVFLVIFKPFRIGDRIDVSNFAGNVEDITLRHTVIRNLENKRIIIPNSIISSDVIVNSNLIDDKVCKHLVFNISYDSDIKLAKKIIQESAINHPLTIDARSEEDKQNNIPIVDVKVVNLGDFSVDIKAWVWANNLPDGFVIQCDLNEIVKEKFEQNNIEIPFPYRTIVQKN